MHLKELLACLILSFVFGIVHAFSVLVVPLENLFDASRSLVSLTYSLSLICLTVMVLFGHRYYGSATPKRIGSLALLTGAAGCLLASVAPALPVVWLGYGVIFGAANGVGYGFALQFSTTTWPDKGGLAMGLVTAFYAFGAMLASPVLFAVIKSMGGQAGFAVQGLLCLLVLPAFWRLNSQSSLSLVVQADEVQPKQNNTHVRTWHIWCAYGFAVFAGLMVISQATEVLAVSGVSRSIAVGAPVLIAASNLIGAILGGVGIDRFAGKWILTGLPVGTAIGILILLGSTGASGLMTGLLLVGFFYGATIAAYPAWISARYGGASGIQVYGRVFTAWGTAGLFAPVLAGAAFDASGVYALALGFSGLLALASCLISFRVTSNSTVTSSSR